MNGEDVPESEREGAHPAMWIGVVSLFPEMFDALTQQGVVGRAIESSALHWRSGIRGITPPTAIAALMTALMAEAPAC